MGRMWLMGAQDPDEILHGYEIVCSHRQKQYTHVEFVLVVKDTSLRFFPFWSLSFSGYVTFDLCNVKSRSRLAGKEKAHCVFIAYFNTEYPDKLGKAFENT